MTQDILSLLPLVSFVDLPLKNVRNFFGQLIKIHFRSLMQYPENKIVLVRDQTSLQLCDMTVTLPPSMCSVVEHQLINNELLVCNNKFSFIYLKESIWSRFLPLTTPLIWCIFILTLDLSSYCLGSWKEEIFSSILRHQFYLISCIVLAFV